MPATAWKTSSVAGWATTDGEGDRTAALPVTAVDTTLVGRPIKRAGVLL